MGDQRTRTGLDLLDSGLADQVWSVKNDATLRFFACECASLALKYCGNGDTRSLKAVEISRCYAKGTKSDDELDVAYADAKEAAEAADEVAFEARDAFEEGKISVDTYTKAFGAARAAFSARDCCRKPAVMAACDAAYEAWTALRTAVEGGSVLGGFVPRDLPDEAIDAAVVVILGDILERLKLSSRTGRVEGNRNPTPFL